MYGSTDRYRLRITTWPGPGDGTATSTNRKLSTVGQPSGRVARCISRPVGVPTLASLTGPASGAGQGGSYGSVDAAQAQRHTPRNVGRRGRPNVVERAGCCATHGL